MLSSKLHISSAGIAGVRHVKLAEAAAAMKKQAAAEAVQPAAPPNLLLSHSERRLKPSCFLLEGKKT